MPEQKESKELNKDAIANQLDQIKKQLEGKNPDLRSTQKTLASIPRARLRGELAIKYDRAKRKYEDEAIDFADTQSAKIRKALDRFRNVLQKGDLLDPDPAIELRSWIKELRDLDLKEDEIPGWSADLKRLSSEAEELGLFHGIKKEIESLWQRADETEKNLGDPRVVMEDYKSALDRIDSELRGSKIKTPATVARLKNLRQRAWVGYNEKLERHNAPSTHIRLEELVGQIKAWVNHHSPDEPTTYFADAEATAISDKMMPVREAIPIALAKLSKLWDEKIKEYTKRGQEDLQTHNLRGALAELENCERLDGRRVKEIIDLKAHISYESNLLIQDLSSAVEQARQKEKEVETLCHNATNELDSLNYLEAMRLVREAEQVDKDSTPIAEAKSKIQAQMLAEASNHVQNAVAWLNEGELGNAGKAIGEASALLGINPTSIASSQYFQPSAKPSLFALGSKPDVSALSSRIQTVAKKLEDIERTEASVAQKVQSEPDQAKKTLDNFVKKYGEDQVEKWEPIHALLNKVEIKNNARKVLYKIKALIGTDPTIANLEKARKEYDSVQRDIAQEYQSEFEAIRKAIDAWLGYLQAIETKNTPSRALELLKPALEYPPLKKKASELKKELELKMASDAEIARELRTMPDRINANPGEAYQEARKYEGQNDDLDELIQQAIEMWEIRTVEGIERLSSQPLTLNSIKQIRSFLKQLKEMESGKAYEYREKCELPCAAAEAALLEKEVPTGKVTWEEVANAWQKAGELAEVYNEAEQASEYSTKERQARKRQTADAVSTAKLEKKIEVYAKLNEEFCGQDTEVLFWFGKACLDMGSQLISRRIVPFSENMRTPREHFDEAARNLEAALALETIQSSSSQIEKLLARARSLGEFEEQKQRIGGLLQHTQIGVGDCTKSKDLYLNTKTEAAKTDPEYAKHLAGWWEERVHDVREIVQNQAQKLPQDADLFTKISPWICILVLSDNPEAEFDAIRRVRMLNDVIRDLEKKIDVEVDNFSASGHDDIYGQFNSADLNDERKGETAGTKMQEVLDKQIGICDNLRNSLREPQSAILVYSNLRLADGIELQNRLIAATQRLDEWITRLRTFKKMIGDVKAWADASLRIGDFTSAKKALGSVTGNPDRAFLGFYGHPTFTWLDSHVDELEAKWNNQQEHKQTIEWSFRFEHSTTSDAIASNEQEWERENVIASGDLKDRHRALVRKLRAALKDNRQYPLELVLAEIKAMQKDDTVDACMLQGKIKYDPNKSTSELDGLVKILPVFQAKVDNLIAVETWLTKITGASPRQDWAEQKGKLAEWWSHRKKEIEGKRDTGFLKTSQEICERLFAEGLDKDGSKIDGFVPLGCAHEWLEELPDSLTEPQPQDPMMRDLREKRDDWARMIDAQVAECKTILNNIKWRREKRDERKDLVLITLNNLRSERERTGRLHFCNKLADRTKEFRQAIEAYKEICPREEWFLEILKEEGFE